MLKVSESVAGTTDEHKILQRLYLTIIFSDRGTAVEMEIMSIKLNNFCSSGPTVYCIFIHTFLYPRGLLTHSRELNPFHMNLLGKELFISFLFLF
jgi:hypothetical protein